MNQWSCYKLKTFYIKCDVSELENDTAVLIWYKVAKIDLVARDTAYYLSRP